MPYQRFRYEDDFGGLPLFAPAAQARFPSPCRRDKSPPRSRKTPTLKRKHMHKLLVGTALACLASGAALATAPTIITNTDVQKVLKLGPKATDHTIRVVDMGQGYNMSVAVVHRGPTGVTPTRTPEQIAAAAAARAKATP